MVSKRMSEELNDLWNQYDPIGVMDDPEWPRDEYRFYIEPCLELLDSGASKEELFNYIVSVVAGRMGFPFGMERTKEAEKFISKMRAWHSESSKKSSVLREEV